MPKNDWKNGKLPVFDSQKYGIVKTDADGNRTIVDPSTALNSGRTEPTPEGGRAVGFMPHFIDGSDAMANKGMTISFQHVPSEEDVTFKAFITSFNETYSCDWNSETVFGRSDPIHMFKNTSREITLAFNIPAASEGEAFDNLARVQRLVTFLYPSYAGSMTQDPDAINQADVMNALTISNSPLVRLRIMNILAARPQIGDAGGSSREEEAARFSTLGTFDRHVKDGGGSEWPSTSIGSSTIAGNYHGGLLGIIKNVTVNQNLDNPDHGVFEINQGTILPKMIEVNMTFAAIHEHTLGWFKNSDGTQTFANQLWPYGVNDVNASNYGGGLPPDVAALQKANNVAFGNLTGSLDELAEEVEQFEQDVANAEARYSGLFGKARFKKDIKKGRYKDNPYIASAVRGEAARRETAAAGESGRNATLENYREEGAQDRTDFSEFID